jgi:hypothetical protein
MGSSGAGPLQGEVESAREVITADLVTDTADGADQRPVGAGINLAAQIIDVNVDNVGDGVGMHTPDFFDDGAREMGRPSFRRR